LRLFRRQISFRKVAFERFSRSVAVVRDPVKHSEIIEIVRCRVGSLADGGGIFGGELFSLAVGLLDKSFADGYFPLLELREFGSVVGVGLVEQVLGTAARRWVRSQGSGRRFGTGAARLCQSARGQKQNHNQYPHSSLQSYSIVRPTLKMIGNLMRFYVLKAERIEKFV